MPNIQDKIAVEISRFSFDGGKSTDVIFAEAVT